MTTLGELINLQRGYDLPETRRRTGTVPVVGSAGITGYHDTAKAKGPGVTVGRSGASFGKVTFIREDYWPHNAALFVTDFKGNEPLFIRYLLESLDFSSLNSGSAQQSLNRNYVYGVSVQKFELPVQRRIAGILSAYDELIENNLQRIRMLEEMAQALYREWFVLFRFPGHENVRMVDSPLGPIPQGWEVTRLGDQLASMETGKRPKGGVRDTIDGVPSIGAENINGIGRHDFANEKFVPRKFFEQMRKGIVRDRDVAIYKDGAYIGKSSYFRDGFPHFECCVNEHVFLLRASGVRLTQSTLYLWLQEPDTVHAIHATNANAAQPGINQQSVGGLELVLPDSKIAMHFDRLVEPMLATIMNLAKRNQNLRRTRDLLLPRLLSGQIPLGGRVV